MNKKALAIFCCICLCTSLSFSQPGTLDSSFGINGKVFTAIDAWYTIGSVIINQPDGKYITAGGTATLEQSLTFSMVRYMPNGKVDSTFGSNGTVITPFNGFYNIAYDADLQSDGKILLSGYAAIPGTNAILIRRYLPNGKIDSSFGTNGYAQLQPTLADIAYCAKVLPDDKILITGKCNKTGQGEDVILIRLLSNGTIDSTFGKNGFTITDYNNESNVGKSICIDKDNKILVSGYNAYSGFMITRYFANGKPDKKYGVNGIATVRAGGVDDRASESGITEDGKLIVAGTTSYFATIPSFAMVRLTDKGILDTSFGSFGKVVTQGNGLDVASIKIGFGIQKNGKIILAGSEYADYNSNDYKVRRYLPNGKIDSAFGTAGYVNTDFNDGADFCRSLLLLDNGSFMVAGNSVYSTDDGYSLARYKGDVPISVSINKNVSVTEGNLSSLKSVKFKIILNQVAANDVFVNYTTKDLNAVAGSDYQSASGRLKIKAGKTSGAITVNIIGDDNIEPNEKFSLILSNPVNAIFGILDSATCVIKNDDPGFAKTSQENITKDVSSFKVFPNPAKNVLGIQLLPNGKISSIQILDLTGKILLQTKTSSDQSSIDISRLVSGTYFVRINAGTESTILKFVKE